MPADAHPDLWTLIAISALAYILSVALHEHGGHAVACVLLGSHPRELGAFYVDCDDSGLGSTARRLVALAGPCMSLVMGCVALLLLRRVPPGAPATAYFTWLLGTLGLTEVGGYAAYSGVSGQGDFGTTADGALSGASPEWLWRAVLTAVGVVLFIGAVRVSLRAIRPRLVGTDPAQLQVPRRAAYLSYFTGGATYALIGAFNPQGWAILLGSALAASLGGTSFLLWMFSHARRYYRRYAGGTPGPGLYFPCSWGWRVAGAAVTIGYALVFARSLRLT